MDSIPSGTSKFVELLNSQQTVSFGNYEESVQLSSSQVPFLGSQGTGASNFEGGNAPERRERRKWTPTDDVVLISSWLNTSKDPVVGNEQKSSGFWKRIAAYFAASPLVAGFEEREPSHCKQRWHRINDLVSKFSGSYEAATRERTSGQYENDVLKLAHQIYYNNYKKKSTLEHAWKELRHDQKWCDLGTATTEGSLKKRKCEVGAVTSSSQPIENKRPPGVKAAKLSGKKPVLDEKTLNDFKCMWTIKEKELASKEKLSKMSLLEILIGRKESLTKFEETLKNKLITDLLSCLGVGQVTRVDRSGESTIGLLLERSREFVVFCLYNCLYCTGESEFVVLCHGSCSHESESEKEFVSRE
ncbi:glutathione S-transferase T3-like [Brassica napus]|uniref:glutathione S-transferase T3-like n=1 Tax=Brassica napus TaxID=3708 RepID=UPI002079BE6B|nr:glutathione S-transferase T3-like [Brassica napus]